MGEFACINFVDTFIKRFKVWEEEENGKDGTVGKYEPSDNSVPAPTAQSECVSTISTQDACVSTQDDDFEDIDEDDEEVNTGPKPSHFDFFTNVLDDFFDIFLKRLFRRYSPIIPQMTIYKEPSL